MKSEPDWRRLPALPPLVGALLRQCFAKDPHQRLADASVFRLALAGALDLPAPAITAAPTARRSRLWLSVAAAAVLVSAGLIARASFRREEAPRTQPTRFTIPLPAGVRFGLTYPRISRDGRMIAFQGMTNDLIQVYVRALDGLDTTPLRGTEGGLPAAFSPDGEWLAVRYGDGQLKKIRLSGGPAVPIAADPNLGNDWAANDTIAIGGLDALATVPAAGGQPQKQSLAGAVPHLAYFGPAFLPGARNILFFGYDRVDAPLSVQLYSIPSRTVRTLLTGSSPSYVASGHLVFGATTRCGQCRSTPIDCNCAVTPCRSSKASASTQSGSGRARRTKRHARLRPCRQFVSSAKPCVGRLRRARGTAAPDGRPVRQPAFLAGWPPHGRPDLRSDPSAPRRLRSRTQGADADYARHRIGIVAGVDARRPDHVQLGSQRSAEFVCQARGRYGRTAAPDDES